MPWNPSPHVADCREIAKKWDADQVIIVGINLRSGQFEVTSYGKTTLLCDLAKEIAKQIHEKIQSGEIDTQP